ncbi:TetR/AcrR family transcriptional regulator [Ruania rhizosphaerae]|uniref:TetR/AcrR family transcriptional regulator n=1 Tax=Ruania rhizosphaerae TaxID=1840413 RepID=UPI00135A4F87|nr:TetR/AcrR family transcriptional regulator [Ruania rhizosphaerae]
MARTQSFDRDTVVRAARATFWHSGYSGTSVPDLEAATGLSRSSIYNAFGSKRGLFDAAVQSYLDEVIRPRLRPMQSEPVEPDAVITYLTGLGEAFSRADSMPATNGCLLVNTAGAPIAQDAHVAAVIAEYRRELHEALTRGIEAHRPTAEPAEVTQLADTTTGLIVAAFALARIDPIAASRSIATARELIEQTQHR